MRRLILPVLLLLAAAVAAWWVLRDRGDVRGLARNLYRVFSKVSG